MSIGGEFTTNFLHAFREARVSTGLSQQTIADCMVERGHGTWRQTTLAKVEAGTRVLFLSEAVDLADIIGVFFAFGSHSTRGGA
jgi:hypothetical protein